MEGSCQAAVTLGDIRRALGCRRVPSGSEASLSWCFQTADNRLWALTLQIPESPPGLLALRPVFTSSSCQSEILPPKVCPEGASRAVPSPRTSAGPASPQDCPPLPSQHCLALVSSRPQQPPAAGPCPTPTTLSTRPPLLGSPQGLRASLQSQWLGSGTGRSSLRKGAEGRWGRQWGQSRVTSLWGSMARRETPELGQSPPVSFQAGDAGCGRQLPVSRPSQREAGGRGGGG